MSSAEQRPIPREVTAEERALGDNEEHFYMLALGLGIN